eukprot:scaffold134016_cov18-Tisochrysis_lutea.AAC.1
MHWGSRWIALRCHDVRSTTLAKKSQILCVSQGLWGEGPCHCLRIFLFPASKPWTLPKLNRIRSTPSLYNNTVQQGSAGSPGELGHSACEGRNQGCRSS